MSSDWFQKNDGADKYGVGDLPSFPFEDDPTDEIANHLHPLFAETEEALYNDKCDPEVEEETYVITAETFRSHICEMLVSKQVPPNFRMEVNGAALNSLIDNVSTMMVQMAGMVDGFYASQRGDEDHQRFLHFLEKLHRSFEAFSGYSIKKD